VGWDWVHLVRRPLVDLFYQPQMIDYDECGAVGGMRIDRGNWSTRRKPAPVPLYPPQILHDLTWARTQAAAVESRRLTAWVWHGLFLWGYLFSFPSSPYFRCCSPNSGKVSVRHLYAILVVVQYTSTQNGIPVIFVNAWVQMRPVRVPYKLLVCMCLATAQFMA
jgi:hypothetical protein